MERLTEYDYVAGVKVGDLKVDVPPERAYDKLAAYEETGLTPDDVARMNDFEKTQSFKLLEQVSVLQAELAAKDAGIARLTKTLSECEAALEAAIIMFAPLENENERLLDMLEEVNTNQNTYLGFTAKEWHEKGVALKEGLEKAVVDYIADRDRWKTRAEEAESENEAWNNADCNTCQLRSWEACEDICKNKVAMVSKIAELSVRGAALERALLGSTKEPCGYCTRTVSNCACSIKDKGYLGFSFAKARFDVRNEAALTGKGEAE